MGYGIWESRSHSRSRSHSIPSQLVCTDNGLMKSYRPSLWPQQHNYQCIANAQQKCQFKMAKINWIRSVLFARPMAGQRKIDYHQFKINMSHKLEGKSTPKAANNIGQRNSGQKDKKKGNDVK